MPSNALEGALDLAQRITKDHRASMRAAHRRFSLGELAEQPFHLGLIERHIDLDGRMASGGGGNRRLQGIDRNRLVLALDAIEDFLAQALGVGIRHAGRRTLNGYALRPHLRAVKSIDGQLLADLFAITASP